VLFEKALFQFLRFFIPQSTTQGPSVQDFFRQNEEDFVNFFEARVCLVI